MGFSVGLAVGAAEGTKVGDHVTDAVGVSVMFAVGGDTVGAFVVGDAVIF